MAYLCSLVMILIVTPGRIPKPCVVGSNPTGGAEYLPLSCRIPPVTRGHLDPHDQTGQEDLPRLHAGWATRRRSGHRSSPGHNAAASSANSSMEVGSDRATNQTLLRSSDEPALRGISTADDATSESGKFHYVSARCT